MPITRLVVDDFRNLKSVEVRPGKDVSLIEGENGSGKTSLLEAIHTLGLGRSFRTRKFKNLISYHQPAFHIYCDFAQQGIPHRLGVTRGRDGTSLFKLDGEVINSAADLAALLPCQVIDSHSFQLLEGGPSERRAFVDWLVFHVKPNFRRVWSDYARCLKQRNSLLRSDRIQRPDFAIWDNTLAKLGGEIDSYRREVVEAFESITRNYLKECDFIESGHFEMSYQAGWDTSKPLLEQLDAHFERDLALGYTSLGPHKSDVRFAFNKRPLVELFSRGQQKAVITAFYLAQLEAFLQNNPRDCVLLIDDLPAELDEQNVQRLCKWIGNLERVQSFMTGIDLSLINRIWPARVSSEEEGARKLFHVKHGQITEQPCHRSIP